MTQLALGTDVNGRVTYLPNVAENNQIINLPQNTEKNFTLPEYPELWNVIFTYEDGSSVIVNLSGTATAPTTSFANGANVLNPSGYSNVSGGTTISVITADANTPTFCARYYPASQ